MNTSNIVQLDPNINSLGILEGYQIIAIELIFDGVFQPILGKNNPETCKDQINGLIELGTFSLQQGIRLKTIAELLDDGKANKSQISIFRKYVIQQKINVTKKFEIQGAGDDTIAKVSEVLKTDS